MCFSINGLNEDNHISREYAAEAKHEAPGAVEGGVGGHPHAVQGTEESVHSVAELKSDVIKMYF